MDVYRPFTSIGWLLIIIGIVFVSLPYLARVFPAIDKLPWFIWWSYRSDGFYFGTSPLLILISIASLLWNLLKR